MIKKYFVLNFAVIMLTTASLMATPGGAYNNRGASIHPARSASIHDVTGEIPTIHVDEVVDNVVVDGFEKIQDVAQYGNADWSHAIGIARGISLEEARQIAINNPEITFFFYTKGGQMVLGTGRGDGSYRVFRHGDTVFFSGTPWFGAANGLADGYIKQ